MTGATAEPSDNTCEGVFPAALPATSTAAEPKLRVVTYRRVASDAPATAASLEAQRAACQRLIEQFGLHLVDVFIEPEYSATETSAR
ncbi:hypothetical protein [Haloechinothrix salitolerans]|uniref:Resolvase, N terminal domain n=1 Tax=Haloechinothrix salitolerans TaxID=926830 RepID=A0ABW2BXB2_9PSEU